MSEHYICLSLEVHESETLPHGICVAAKVGPFKSEHDRDTWEEHFHRSTPATCLMNMTVATTPWDGQRIGGCAYVPNVIQPGLYVSIMRTLIDRYTTMVNDDLRELTLTPVMLVVANDL